MALTLSVFYLLAVISTILFGPVAAAFANIGPLELMGASQLWLAPLQGLVAASLGVFFYDSRRETHDAQRDEDGG